MAGSEEALKYLLHSLLVGAGGFTGAIARYWLAGFLDARMGGGFPWGTLAVNVLGSFIIAVLLNLLPERFGVPETLRLLVSVGFLGSFTTFSTFSYDSYGLLSGAEPGRALLNIGLNVGLGLLAVWAGFLLTRPA